MKSYGQFCPVAKAAELFCERWTPLIIRDLALGTCRFRELQRGVPLCSPTLLSHRLKQLQAEGIVERQRSASGVSTYRLTESGREFIPLVMALGVWGQRWTRRELAKDELDLGLLIWALERSVRPRAFGKARTVVQLIFTDQSVARRNCWFVNEGDEVEICLKDPGYDVDLYVSATLPDVIRIWRGDLMLASALDDGRAEAHGSAAAMRALPIWFSGGALSHVKPVVSERTEA